MPAFRATETVVDAAELARLRAIEAAAMEWGNAESGSIAAVKASRALATVLLLCSSESDNPPAPLPTDEQISRLLRENELLRGRLAEARRMASYLSEWTLPANLKAELAAK